MALTAPYMFPPCRRPEQATQNPSQQRSPRSWLPGLCPAAFSTVSVSRGSQEASPRWVMYLSLSMHLCISMYLCSREPGSPLRAAHVGAPLLPKMDLRGRKGLVMARGLGGPFPPSQAGQTLPTPPGMAATAPFLSHLGSSALHRCSDVATASMTQRQRTGSCTPCCGDQSRRRGARGAAGPQHQGLLLTARRSPQPETLGSLAGF